MIAEITNGAWQCSKDLTWHALPHSILAMTQWGFVLLTHFTEEKPRISDLLRVTQPVNDEDWMSYSRLILLTALLYSLKLSRAFWLMCSPSGPSGSAQAAVWEISGSVVLGPKDPRLWNQAVWDFLLLQRIISPLLWLLGEERARSLGNSLFRPHPHIWGPTRSHGLLGLCRMRWAMLRAWQCHFLEVAVMVVAGSSWGLKPRPVGLDLTYSLEERGNRENDIPVVLAGSECRRW